LLGGHPLSISLAAPLLEYKTLSELFADFLRNDFSVLDYQSSLSIESTVSLALERIKENSPEAL
jgi:hypothetical protein